VKPQVKHLEMLVVQPKIVEAQPKIVEARQNDMINKNHNHKSTLAFSLVELMISITIIGILSVIAIPNFHKYKYKAKIAESYVVINGIEKAQQTFILEYNEFRRLFSSPWRPYYENPNPTMVTVQDTLDLKELGYPLRVGSTPYFAYKVVAGKTDENGDDVTSGPGDFDAGQYGRVLTARAGAPPLSLNSVGGTQACNPIINVQYFNGLAPSDTTPHYNWAVIIGYANFNNQRCIANQCDSCYVNVKSLVYQQNTFTGSPLIEIKEDFTQ